MDWRTVTFDWNRARAFLVTAEEGSFSAAARALGLSQPTVGRQVTALEEELDVALFERVGHGLVLTPTGLELVDHVRAMGEAATRVSLAATGQSQSIDGNVCVTASEVIATHLLPPIVARLRAAHPGITIDIVASNAQADLRRREADIALRNVRPTQPDLVARKLPEGAARLYATPAYLASQGDPATPEALAACDFVGFDRSETFARALQGLGLPVQHDRFVVVSESQLAQWAMVKAGLGVGMMMQVVADADPAVRLALPDLPAFPVPMWLTAHRELHTSRRIRVVFDLLAEALGG
ncbi:MAG: LysR family transcriptional regulator [Myxococcales bacterium]|nr:LysR family transcriptional regulator [Myxococcales bacterium]